MLVFIAIFYCVHTLLIDNFYLANTPMEQNQPKKRGRKKKIRVEEPKPFIPVPEPQEVKVPEKIEVKSLPINRISKEEATKKLEEAVRVLDDALMPNKIVDKIHEKIMAKVMINTKTDNIFEDEHLKIYQKIQYSEADRNEIQRWQSQITLEMAKKMCRILNFLLQNGPLNKIENSIMENCLNALKSYYNERAYLHSIDKDKYTKTTYFPEKNSCIFKFLVEVIQISFLNE